MWVCGCLGLLVGLVSLVGSGGGQTHKCRLSVGAVTALERLDRDRMISAVARQTRTENVRGKTPHVKDEVCVRVCARVCMCVVETRDPVRRRSGLDFLFSLSLSETLS